jgi:hypothetical protein
LYILGNKGTVEGDTSQVIVTDIEGNVDSAGNKLYIDTLIP